MNLMRTTVGAVAAVAKVASKAYNYAEHFGVFNGKAKVEAETRSVEVTDNQSADMFWLSFLLSRIPVFNGSGYEIWSSMMKTFFVCQDLWDMVDRGYEEEELTVEVLREVRKKDAMALLFIQQAIHKSVFSCIASASKSKEAWDALQKKYQGDEEEPNPQNSVDESSSVLSCPAANATEFREAWDAPEQGYKANTKVKAEQPQAGNPNGGVSQSLTTLLVSDLDMSVTDVQLLGIFICFGQVVSSGVCRDMANATESVSSCSTNATESREASDAPQRGHQANTEVKAQAQVGNPSGGSILIMNLDKAIDERALHAIFSAFGNILSCKVETMGYGHIEYESEEAAQEAIEKVNGLLLNHKKVYVGPFVSKQERPMAYTKKARSSFFPRG